MNNNSNKKTIVRYAASIVIALAIVALMLYAQGLVKGTSLEDVYLLLANAFTVPGLIYVLLAALFWVAGEGTFDMLSYGASKAAHLFIPFLYKGKTEAFYDYKVRKAEERAQKPGFSHILFVGLALLVLAGIFIALFYSV